MKKLLFVLLVMLLTIVLTSCFDSGEDDSNQILDVSIIQLIANPEKYHGKMVRIDGVADIDHHGLGALYLTKYCWYNIVQSNALFFGLGRKFVDDGLWITDEGIWLTVVDDLVPLKDAEEKYNGKYVLIEGTFDMNYKGKRQQHVGGIINITRFSLSTIYRGFASGEARKCCICGCHDDN